MIHVNARARHARSFIPWKRMTSARSHGSCSSYGELAERLMETRARNCARHGERESAAFWQKVGEEVSKLAAAVEATVIRREVLRKPNPEP